MPRLDLQTLAKRYGLKPGEIRGDAYRELMKVVTAREAESVARGVARMSADVMQGQVDRLGEQYADIIRFPDYEKIVPTKNVFLRKAAQDGDVIADTLRNKLTGRIRAALAERDAAGRPAYLNNRGRLRPQAVKRLREEMRGVYKWYTGRSGQEPSNLDQIATTEMNSVVNAVKHEYNAQFSQHNADIGTMRKTWRQNKHLSKVPRQAHTYMHGRTIALSELFNVPIMKKVAGGREVRKGWEQMAHPHAAGASAGNVINCHCSCDYTFTLKQVGTRRPRVEIVDLPRKRKLQSVRPKLIQLALHVETIWKAALPVGHVSTHADGSKWKKQPDGTWTKVMEPGKAAPEEKKEPEEKKRPPSIAQLQGDFTKIKEEITRLNGTNEDLRNRFGAVLTDLSDNYTKEYYVGKDGREYHVVMDLNAKGKYWIIDATDPDHIKLVGDKDNRDFDIAAARDKIAALGGERRDLKSETLKEKGTPIEEVADREPKKIEKKVEPVQEPKQIEKAIQEATPDNRSDVQAKLMGFNPGEKTLADVAAEEKYEYEPAEEETIFGKSESYEAVVSKNITMFQEKGILEKTIPPWMPNANEEFFKYENNRLPMVKLGVNKYYVKTSKTTGVVASLDVAAAMQDFYLKRAKARYKNDYEDYKKELQGNMDKQIEKRKDDIKKTIEAAKNGSMTQDRADAMIRGLEGQISWFEEIKADKKPKFGKRAPGMMSTSKMTYTNQDMYYAVMGEKSSMKAWKMHEEVMKDLKQKMSDMSIQYEEMSNTHAKGEETSYGDKGVKPTILKSHGVLVKRQNGSEINEQDTKEIAAALDGVYQVFGNRSEMAKKFNLKISHAGETLMHARKACGIFFPHYHAIGVSGGSMGFTMAHEWGHFMDYYVGQQQGNHYMSDKSGGSAHAIAKTFRENMRDAQSSDYQNRTCECFARALAQYYAYVTGDDESYKSRQGVSGNHPDMNVFKAKLAPLIEHWLQDNDQVLKSFYIDVAKALPVGHVSTRSDGTKWKKQPDGTWKKIKEGKEPTAGEGSPDEEETKTEVAREQVVDKNNDQSNTVVGLIMNLDSRPSGMLFRDWKHKVFLLAHQSKILYERDSLLQGQAKDKIDWKKYRDRLTSEDPNVREEAWDEIAVDLGNADLSMKKAERDAAFATKLRERAAAAAEKRVEERRKNPARINFRKDAFAAVGHEWVLEHFEKARDVVPNGVATTVTATRLNWMDAAMSYNASLGVIEYYPDTHEDDVERKIVDRIMEKVQERIDYNQHQIDELKGSTDADKEERINDHEAAIEKAKTRFFTIAFEEHYHTGGQYNQELMIQGQFTHEIGHALYFQLLTDQEKADVEDSQEHRGGPDFYLSGYAGTNVAEFFAEMYALYKSKVLLEKKKKIPEKVLSIFEKYAPNKGE